jgi:hypothetical protein
MSCAIAAVCEGLKGGGAHRRAVLTSTVEAIPPTVPSRVLWGLTPGATGLFPAGFSPDILEDVAELHREDKEEKQVGVFSVIIRNREGQQHRHVADGIDADEERPLDARRAHEKVF